MLAHGSPKTVFIGGGGEGATAREVLRWKSVEKVVMCDIDEVACRICREQLPEWNTGVYEDER
jgi:spermidine synthase